MGLPQPGEIFDNFKVIDVAGEGGMGQVLVAEDIKLGRKVALKFLSDDVKKMDPKILVRFENEARIMASLNHPNIVNIYTFGTYAGIHYLVMEFVEGITLSKVIEKKSFGVLDASHTIKQILTGLQQAHDKGILHRDIKPANLLIDNNNQLKIVDFGISKSLLEDDPNLTKENHFIGTLNYMAPEILKGYPPSPAADIYSTGVVFYELLTGHNPFVGTDKIKIIDKIRHEQLQIPEEVRSLLPPQLLAIVNRMIENDKDKRYQSCLQVLNDFHKINDDSLPDFHGVSLRPEITIENRDEVQKKLLKRKYQEHEIEIITKLAVNLVELKRVSEELEDDSTADLSPSSSTPSLVIDPESLELAIENFENSKDTALRNLDSPISTAEIDFVGKNKNTVPFPLFRPKFLIKWSLIVSFITFNIAVFAKIAQTFDYDIGPLAKLADLIEVDFDLEGKKKGENLANSNKEESAPSTLEKLKQQVEQAAERSLSSVPAGVKKPLPAGTRVQFRAVKFNSRTGDYLYNQSNTLLVKKIKDEKMYSLYRDGKTGHWSTQHLSSNAFVPPLHWYSKGSFNIAVTPRGNFDDLYPLHVGKKADFNFKTLTAGGAFFESERQCEVVKTLQKNIAGHQKDLFVVECTTITDDKRVSGTYLYSPEWNIVVEKKLKEKGPQGEFEETLTIESINLN